MLTLTLNLLLPLMMHLPCLPVPLLQSPRSHKTLSQPQSLRRMCLQSRAEQQRFRRRCRPLLLRMKQCRMRLLLLHLRRSENKQRWLRDQASGSGFWASGWRGLSLRSSFSILGLPF